MLKLIIGRAGAGKSEYLYRMAAARAREGAKKAVFLVPETYSHAAERQLCTYGGDAVNLSCEVLTFRRLANRVFSVFGGLAEQTLDEAGRILLMQQALESAAPQLGYYRSSAKIQLLEAMCALVDELKSACVTPEALAGAAADASPALGAKLSDLAVIFAGYSALCADTRLDARDILSLCAEKLKGSGYFDGRDVYLDGFSGFTPQELDILKNLRNANVTAAFTLDSLCDPDPLFLKPARAAARLMNLLADGHAEVISLEPPRRASGLAHLETHLFRFSGAPGTCEGGEVRFHYAPDIYSECEYAAAQARMLLQQGARLRDIAVAAGDFETYRLPLCAAFERCGLPYYSSENTPLESKAPAAVLFRALDIACEGFSHDTVFSYLKTGLAGFSDEECSELENYCLRWRIRPRQWTQRTPWQMHPGGFGLAFDETAKQRLSNINALRDRLRAPLMRLSGALARTVPAREKLRALYDFAEEIQLGQAIDHRAAQLAESAPDEAAAYAQIWELFIHCIDQFDELSGTQILDAQQFSKTMQRMLRSCDIGVIPPSADRISIAALTSAAAHGASYLFLLGAYDGAFPPDSGSGGLLSDYDRDILDAQGIELGYTAQTRESEMLFSLYSAVASARRTLFLSVPQRDGSGQALTPAFLFRRAAGLLPDAPITNGNLETWLSTPEMAFDYAFSTSGPQADAARAVLRAWPGFAEAAARLCGISDPQAMEQTGFWPSSPSAWRLTAEENARLFGINPRISASRLEAYNNCPFSYLARYGLSLNARRTADFDAPQAGIFIHYVLEGTVRNIKEHGGFAACTVEMAKDFAQTHVRDYILRDIPDFESKSARFRYLFLRLRKNLDFLVENLYDEFSNSAFAPLDFELHFSAEMPPVEIPLDSGAHASLSGVADRVDGWVRDGVLYLRVVDYKSGTKAFSYGEISAGLGMQLPVYLFALQANARLYLNRHPELDADAIVPAGILYTPARLEALSSTHDLPDDELAAALDEKLRRSGIVLDDADVLAAMEPGLETRGEGRYIPVKITKSGIRGAVSEKQFALLGRHVREMLKTSAELMASGHYRPQPVQSGQNLACRYCEYRPVCGLDAAAHPQQVRFISSRNAAEFFADVEKGDL